MSETISEDCKSSYVGSIPAPASNLFNSLRAAIARKCRKWRRFAKISSAQFRARSGAEKPCNSEPLRDFAPEPGRAQCAALKPPMAQNRAHSGAIPCMGGTAGRNAALDGIRGALALGVLLFHAAGGEFTAARGVGQSFVFGFFILSGFVLTATWRKGEFLAFLVRRVVRLWPVYAVCLAGAALAAGHAPDLREWVFLRRAPILSNWTYSLDPARWSLFIEIRAILFMPLIVWIGRRGPGHLLAGSLACFGLAFLGEANFVFGPFFLVGAYLTRYRIRAALFELPAAQWLGRISYPLYLSHHMILHQISAPLWVRLVLCFAVAQALTMTVERLSLAGSRAVARRPLNMLLTYLRV